MAANQESASPLTVEESSAVPVLAPAGTGRFLTSGSIANTAWRIPSRTGPSRSAKGSRFGAGKSSWPIALGVR